MLLPGWMGRALCTRFWGSQSGPNPRSSQVSKQSQEGAGCLGSTRWKIKTCPGKALLFLRGCPKCPAWSEKCRGSI